jgi:hypothetical protein
MTVLVRQNTAGTTQLNGSAPDPINVPGNTWYASNPTHYLRSASGGVLIPDAAFWAGLLSYNVATARQKITISNAVLLTSTDYIFLHINGSTQTAAAYGSGTGYFVQIKAGQSVQIYEWSGSGAPTARGTGSAALPSSPITVSSAYIEHLTSGTLNASVTVGGTTYTTTATVGSPLAGAYAGLYSNSGASGGITASEIQIEDAGSALTTLVVQSSPGTSALNGTAPDPTNVPGLNWFATTASFARLAGGGITNGGAGLSTLSYLLPTNLHKASLSTTSSLANGNQYVMLLCNGSANNASLFSGSGYYLYIRGGGLSTASIIRVVSAVQTHTINFTGSPLTNGVITAASLDCSVSGTVSASITFGGNTYTQSYTDPSPLTGSYAGSVFGDQGGGTVTMASLTLEGIAVSYQARITWAEAQYQSSGVSPSTDYSEPLSRGIFRGIERGVA